VSRTSESKDIVTGAVALSDVDQTVLSIIPNPLAKEYHAGTLQPVPVPGFADHVNHMHANDDYLFSEEYSAVEPNHAPTCEATLRAENQIKNRYHNITACKLKCSQFNHSVSSYYISLHCPQMTTLE